MIPAIFTNQFRTLKVQTLREEYDSHSYLGTEVLITNLGTTFGKSTPYYQWSSTTTDSVGNAVVVGGDSGDPLMTVVNGKLVALGTWHFSQTAPDISSNITAINTAISSLGSSYPLTTIDLSAFSSY